MHRETLTDRHGLGVPVILEKTHAPAARLPTCELLNESELRLILPTVEPCAHNL